MAQKVPECGNKVTEQVEVQKKFLEKNLTKLIKTFFDR